MSFSGFSEAQIKDQCPHCHQTGLIRNIGVGQNAEVSPVGLKHKAMILFIGVEEFLADLCPHCGSIARLHVAETNRKWLVHQEAGK